MIYKLWRFLKNYKAERHLRQMQKRGLKLGQNVFIQGQVLIDPSRCYLVSIGDNCTIAARTYILAHDASMFFWLKATRIGRVCIHENCFIGAGSIILPGVSIGPNTIVGAGSIVTKSLPPNSVCLGNPATKICDLESFLNRHKQLIGESKTFAGEIYDRHDLSEELIDKITNELSDKRGYSV